MFRSIFFLFLISLILAKDPLGDKRITISGRLTCQGNGYPSKAVRLMEQDLGLSHFDPDDEIEIVVAEPDGSFDITGVADEAFWEVFYLSIKHKCGGKCYRYSFVNYGDYTTQFFVV